MSNFGLSLKIRSSDMEKGADVQTLSAEIFEKCGNFWIVEDFLL